MIPDRYRGPQDWDEKRWLEEFRGFAKTLGWFVYHPHRSKRSETGFPDVTLVRERVVFVELKTHRKDSKLTPAQEEWRDRLLAAGAEWYELRPLDDLVAVLGRRRRAKLDPEVARTRLLDAIRARGL